jgi:hypothetical protein
MVVVDTMSRAHPRLQAGLWFGAAALLPAAAIGVYYLLLLAAEGPLVSGSQHALDLIMALYLVALPPALAFGAGALIGGRILAEPAPGCLRAAGIGAMVGAAWLFMWVLTGEGLVRLLDLHYPPEPAPALLAFGYGMVALGGVLLVLWNAMVGWRLGRSARGG